MDYHVDYKCEWKYVIFVNLTRWLLSQKKKARKNKAVHWKLKIKMVKNSDFKFIHHLAVWAEWL